MSGNLPAEDAVDEEIEEYEAAQSDTASEKAGEGTRFDSLDDLKPARGEDSERIPDEYYIEELGGTIRVAEPTQGEIEDLIQPFFDEDADVENGMIADLATSLYPDLGEVSEADVSEFKPNFSTGILIGALFAAGMDDAVELIRGDPSEDLIERTEQRAGKQQRLREAAERGR